MFAFATAIAAFISFSSRGLASRPEQDAPRLSRILPGDLEACIGRFVEHHNHQRYHESLNNLTPADVYFGRGQTILLKRERIKRDTIQNRRLQHQRKAA